MNTNLFLEIFSAAAGLSGAVLLATKSKWAPWAWAIWLISNIGWIAFGIHMGLWGVVAQNAGFTVTSALGAWVWLIKPYLDKKVASSSGRVPDMVAGH